MASASAASLGLPDPRMIDPYQIESTLASATLNPTTQAAALPLLGMYQAQRGMQSSNYLDQLALTRQLTQQKLSADIAKDAAEGLSKMSEHGILRMAGPNSVWGTGGWLAGQDPNVVGALAGLKESNTAAQTYERVGQGTNQLTQAGFPPTAQGVGALLGTPVSLGTPTSTTNAQIAAAGSVEAAQQATKPGLVIETPLPHGASARQTLGPGDVRQGVETSERLRSGAYGSGAPGHRAPPGVGQAIPQAPGGQANAPPGAAIVNMNTIMQKLQASNDPADKATLADIQAGSSSGNPRIERGPNGKWVMIGKSGNPYQIER